jgi:ribosome-binding factor A
MSPTDLRHATIFVKPLLGQDEEAVLKSASHAHRLSAALRSPAGCGTKYASQAQSPRDESFDEGHIDNLLRSANVRRISRGMIELDAPMRAIGCRAELLRTWREH